MVAIIDYDAGNIKSVEKAVAFLGKEAIITREPEEIMNADQVILPGVGNFGDAMEKLEHYSLIPVIHEIVEKKIPFLGICLGLQLLFERSEECLGVAGLGILRGEIKRIPHREGLKIPHIGWNSLAGTERGRLFRGLPKEPYVYFVHSYYLQAEEKEIVTTTTEYGITIHSSIEKDNVFACQFHPEKSSEVGLKILDNFLKLRQEGMECIPKE
ncbi:MAG: imidazole glycerol phosphate synthase subunit HisH [Lachnospiraceae bacterium]|nr:imidazole glycerol phosphate synthase subunit HisH [Lachnospiraceae bacterium]MDD7050811.1 imidazole glycerol phosphate synthase subunit HisH [Lachnospiraceae bacterium]MDY3223689.1 imidazole glycerol phosphate synthase subunit HisH [Lachnospiraceae bacterium]MDY4095845.1 imidazole glycerol phosphate synthase subunit HisH [Lachnospiraceae bacterium]